MAFRFEPSGGYTPAPNFFGEDGPGITSTDSMADNYLNFVGSSRPAAEAEVVPYVYTGKGEGVRTTGHPTSPVYTASTYDKKATVEDLVRKFERLDRKDQRALAFQLVLAGYTPGKAVKVEDAAEEARNMSLGEVADAYTNLLDVAAGRYAVGQKVTPDQILAREIAYRLPGKVEWDGNLGSLSSALNEAGISTKATEKEEDLAGTFTSTSRDVTRDIMDPNDAMALTRGMLQRELGRDPTKAEFEDFISTIQYAQRVNPTVGTNRLTQTTDSEGRIIDTKSVTNVQQGIGAEGLADVALREARSNPSWAEWQAVGVYGPALEDALGATIRGL